MVIDPAILSKIMNYVGILELINRKKKKYFVSKKDAKKNNYSE
jgi:hypothetical protein